MRQLVTALLLVGLSGHLLLPYFGQAQKAAFSQWLHHNVVPTNGDQDRELRDAIRSLPATSSSFQALVHNATELVNNNKDKFRMLPLSGDQPADRMSFWLVDQWSHFHHHKTGQNALLPDALSQTFKWVHQPGAVLSAAAAFRTLPVPGLTAEWLTQRSVRATLWLPPLVSGISINAP